MSWENVELQDVSEYRTERIETNLLNDKNYVSTENMISDKGGIVDSSYPPSGNNSPAFRPNDTLVSNIRPYFKKIWFARNEGGCSNDVIVFKPYEEKIDPKFLYFQLSKDEFFDYMMSGANGTKMPRGNKKAIPKFKFSIPTSLETQKRIASILSTYDDLIENNLKRIKLLEETAQNIYKEWFVNFRFPNYEHMEFDVESGLPVGWEFKKADKVYDINIGKTPPRGETQWFSLTDGIKWVSIADMNKSTVFVINTNEKITKDGVDKFNMRKASIGSILLSFKLTVGSVAITNDEVVTNEAIAHFNLLEDSILTTEYTYQFLKNFHYPSLGSTSSIGISINSKIVKNMDIVIPPKKLIEDFTTSVKNIFAQTENLILQNQKLKESRDILLPRLMNRTIEV